MLGNDYPIVVQNAGLVLLGPFLYTLFNRLDMLTDDGDGSAHFVGIEGASRAVHLLQYLVDTRLDAPAEALPLNKLLCGLSPDAPVWPSLTPAQADLDVCDQLLEAARAMAVHRPLFRASVARELSATWRIVVAGRRQMEPDGAEAIV